MPQSTHDHDSMTPSNWIARWVHVAGCDARVLDLACGGGRHGRLFLGERRLVTFVDIDVDRLADLRNDDRAEIVRADLEGGPWPLGERRFDLVIVVNYLWRPLLPRIVAAVAPGGYLLYQTFAAGNEAFGRPRNPDYLLRRGELLDAVEGSLDVIGYAHTLMALPHPAVMQHIVARRPASVRK